MQCKGCSKIIMACFDEPMAIRTDKWDGWYCTSCDDAINDGDPFRMPWYLKPKGGER